MSKPSKTSIGAGRLERVRTGVVCAVACVAAAALAAFCAWQLSHYEDGLLETYANQQDDYVRLAADELSRAGDGDVEAILGSIGPSSSQYWMLAEDGSLVFVKDVDGTNRYRGFSTATYFKADEARAFVDGLAEGTVSHAMLAVDGREFIASGTEVVRDGSVLTLCLLTGRHVVIDQNAYLGARVGLGVAIGAALLLMIAGCVLMGLRGDRLRDRALAAESECERLRRTNERLGSQKLAELMGVTGPDGAGARDGEEEDLMAHATRRVYRFKSYLNASHYVSFDGKRGETHPHTWQFSAKIQVGTGELRPFADYEQAIDQVFEPYQNHVVNECEPFDAIVPTLESLVEVLGQKVAAVVEGMGARLLEFEGAETPARSYLLSYAPDDDDAGATTGAAPAGEH